MAITQVSGHVQGAGNGTSVTFAVDSGSGSNRLFAWFGKQTAAGFPSGVTYAGSACTDGGNPLDTWRLYYKVANATGTNNCVVSYSAYGQSYNYPATFAGVDQTTPTTGLTGGSGGSGSPSYSQTPPTDGATFGCSFSSYTNSMTWTGTGTSISIATMAFKVIGGSAFHTAASTFSWSTDSAWWHGFYVGLNPATEASIPPTRPVTILDAVHRASNW